ncbi:hypothetical protein EVG20_g4930 [Dentipellis fragilis]|uniref:Cytochrome b5 heme-binding domain-containing protein n=1 Tax=Dentipellis fragilis TaxID=205917 RepID=A0A4Y9YVB1_9AGAM|nr:hypothetical protein EVG20_g4930 [Dentipellis fragilis]
MQRQRAAAIADDALNSTSLSAALVGLLLALPAALILHRTLRAHLTPAHQQEQQQQQQPEADKKEEKTSIMQAERTDLAPPKDDPFTLEQLKEFDGSDEYKPIYVAIKGASGVSFSPLYHRLTRALALFRAGTVFDVTHKRDTYGPGKSYSIFAGKDASKGLGMSSLKEEDAVPDYSTLPANERKVLDDWHAFFTKRYNVVGKVVDLPNAVANL